MLNVYVNFVWYINLRTRLLLGKQAVPGKFLKDVVLDAKGDAIALRSLPGFCANNEYAMRKVS